MKLTKDPPLAIMLKILLWLGFSLFFTLVNAQDNSLRLSRLSIEEGLSHRSVNAMLLDQDGYLWLATKAGLDRYDGYQIVKVSGPNNIFFNGQSINYIFQDNSGLMWINDDINGLYTLNLRTNQYKKISLDSLGKAVEPLKINKDHPKIHSIVEQSNGDLWLAAENKLLVYRRASGAVEQVFTLKGSNSRNNQIRHLLIHKQHIYIASAQGIFVVNHKSGQFKPLAHTPTATTDRYQQDTKALHIKDEQLWIGTTKGLYSIAINNIGDVVAGNVPQASPKVRLKERNIWQILPRNDGLYLATDQGVVSYKPNENTQKQALKTLVKFSDDDKLDVASDNVMHMLSNNQGDLWLLSRLDGAYYWQAKNSAFSTIYRKKSQLNQLSNNRVWAVQSDQQFLWVGTRNGLNSVNVNTGTVKQYLANDETNKNTVERNIYNIIKDKNNLLWLLSYNGSDWKTTLFDTQVGLERPLLLANKQAQRVMSAKNQGHWLDPQGIMWLASEQHFYRFDRHTGLVNKLNAFDGIIDPQSSFKFLGALPGKARKILLSTPNQVWLYDTATTSLSEIYAVPQSGTTTMTMASSWQVDKHNNLWLTIPGYGLVALDATSFALKHHYTQQDKLSNNNVYGAQLDAYGDLWISSNNGLMRLDTDSQHVEIFTRKNGLATNEFNGGPRIKASTRFDDGRLAFASMRGALVFDPADFQQKSDNFEVKITNLSLLSRPLMLGLHELSGSQLILNHDDIGLAINFSTMNFSGQDNTRYRYELTGKKSLKYPESLTPSLLIPQLLPGEYRFTLVAIDPKSGAESKPKSIDITIKHAPWASPVAYSLYALIFLIAALLRMQRNRSHHNSLLSAHENVLKSEERLQLALDGSQSGVWDYKIQLDLMFEPRVSGLLNHHQFTQAITFAQHLELIHPNDKGEFESAWRLFLANAQHNFEVTYRMKNNLGQWLWFRDLGRVTKNDEQGKVARITGAYTNITETKANQLQANLFGEAFEQTRDWVFILDDELKVIAANRSLRNAFGINPGKNLPVHDSKVIGISSKKRRFYTEIMNKLQAGQHWQGEELVVDKQGRSYPVIISLNAVGKASEVAYFVIVLTDISAQKAAENDLRKLASYDSLTGLPNRALLLDRIKHATDHARRFNFNMALFFIDLDRFKQVNDSLGHDMGDELLVNVAQKLKAVLRETDTVARLGGDEFVILLESYHHLDEVSHIAQKVIIAIDQPIELSKGTVRVSPSIGIALYPEDAQNHGDLLKSADVAMYHAKKSGRSNFQYFTEKMNEQARRKLNQESRFKQGFANNEFVNYYQPIVDTHNNKLKGFELLLRWKTAGGLISPSEFIPLAEDTGLIVNMTQNAIRQGLIDLRQWYDLGHAPYLSINLSVKDLESTSLADDIELLVKVSGIPMSSIRFEITESALMRDITKAINTMNRLKQMGAVLALDDFGTGYSSLKYLKEFPIDIIKIDRSFVKDIGVDSNDEAIIDSIIVMANSLGMHCIAEGVETHQQLAFLKARNCSLIQGFLFSKPLPKDQAFTLIDKVLPRPQLSHDDPSLNVVSYQNR